MKRLIIILVFIAFLSTKSKTQGCFLTTTQSPTIGTLYNNSGNPQLDNAINIERNALSLFFGVNCSVFFYSDSPEMNAQFTPEINNPSFLNGTIVFGFKLLQEQLQKFNQFGGGGGIPFIFAHETGHAKAHQMGWHFGNNFSVKKDELFADYCAGIFMHYRQYMTLTNIQSALSTFFTLGDYQFTNPNHHGTPQERINAVTAGYNYMQYYKTNFPNIPFTDQTLFQSAVNYLNTYVSNF